MQTIQINLYTFDELNEEAQEKAIEDWRRISAEGGYVWSGEALDTLKAGIKHFDGILNSYDIDWYTPGRSKVEFETDTPDYYDAWDDDMSSDEYEAEMKKWVQAKIDGLGAYNPDTGKGLGDCKLTGVCFDEAFGDGAREAFLKGETDVNEIVQAGVEELLSYCMKDYEYQMSDEAIKEDIRANREEPTFLENGEEFQ